MGRWNLVLAIVLCTTACARSEPCDPEPIADYLKRRSELPVDKRMVEASHALGMACLHRIKDRFVRQRLAHRSDTAVFRPMPTADREPLWNRLCGTAWTELPEGLARWERQRFLWDHCELSALSPFEESEMVADSFAPAVWAVGPVAVEGGIAPDQVRVILRDASRWYDGPPTIARNPDRYLDEEPSLEGIPLSTSRRPPPSLIYREPTMAREHDKPLGIVFAGDEPVEPLVWLLDDITPGSPMEAVVESEREATPHSSIRMFAPELDANAIELWVHADRWELGVTTMTELDPAAITAEIKDPGARPRLRLRVDWATPWQRVISTLDGLCSACGGWQPPFGRDPDDPGPDCPFSRIELTLEDETWPTMRLVITKTTPSLRPIAAGHSVEALRARIDTSQIAIERCLRGSEQFHRQQGHALALGFGLADSGALSVGVFIEDTDHRSAEIEDDGPFPSECIPEALGLPAIRFPRTGLILPVFHLDLAAPEEATP